MAGGMSSSDLSVGVIVNYRTPEPGLVARCARSLIEQHFLDWTAYFCDDASAAPQEFDPDQRIRYRRNVVRLGGMANIIYTLAQMTEDIVVHLDGDDCMTPWALSYIVDAHQNGADATWGNALPHPTEKQAFRYRPGPFTGDYRNFECFAPRTYRLELFREAWRRWGWAPYVGADGMPWMTAMDIAIMYPILRLAKNPVPLSAVLYYITRTGFNHDVTGDAVFNEIVSRVEALP
jgi:hypothetical protein